MTVSSIRTTEFRQFITKTVNYAVPAAAIIVFAAVLANASKIDKQISDSASDQSIENEIFIASFIIP